MRLEGIIFDLFDTLLQLEPEEAYYPPSLRKLSEFLARQNVNVSFEDFRTTYFAVREELYSESSKSLEEPHFNVRVAKSLRTLGYFFDEADPVIVGATKAFADEFAAHVSLDEDAHYVLQKLRRRYKFGLVSNFAIPECALNLLDKFELNQYFEAIVISGDVNKRKPSPEIFDKVLKSMDITASKAVFVGDRLDLDVAGPKSVGMKTVHLKRKPSVDSSPVEPDLTINRLRELVSAVEKL